MDSLEHIGFFFASPIVKLFSDDPLVWDIGAAVLRFQCFALPTFALTVFSNMFFQAIGKSWRATVLAVCRPGILIPMTFLLSGRFGLPGLECCQMITDLLSFVLAACIMGHYFKFQFSRQ